RSSSSGPLVGPRRGPPPPGGRGLCPRGPEPPPPSEPHGPLPPEPPPEPPEPEPPPSPLPSLPDPPLPPEPSEEPPGEPQGPGLLLSFHGISSCLSPRRSRPRLSRAGRGASARLSTVA